MPVGEYTIKITAPQHLDKKNSFVLQVKADKQEVTVAQKNYDVKSSY